MNKLKMIKNVIIFFILTMATILFLPLGTTEAAYYSGSRSEKLQEVFDDKENAVGRTFNITRSDYWSKDNKWIYCISKNMDGIGTHTISAYIKIEGNSATIYAEKNGELIECEPIVDDSNAEFAYLLGGGNYVKGYGTSGRQGEINKVNIRQIGVWRYLGDKTHTNNLAIFREEIPELGRRIYSSTWQRKNKATMTNASWRSSGAQLESEMEEYAESLKDNVTVEADDTTLASTVDTNGYEVVENASFEYTGTISSIEFTDANGNSIDTNSIRFNYQNEERTYDWFIQNYTSGNNFNIINTSGNYIENIKINVESTEVEVITTEMWILSGSDKQPRLIVKTEKKEKTIESSLELKVERKGKIIINKKDADTSEAIQNVGFKIYINETGWLSGNVGGPYTYTNRLADASTYYTNSNGAIELDNLSYATYTIWEVETPDEYQLDGQDGYRESTDKFGDVVYGVSSGAIVCNSASQTITYNLNNTQKINISGYVWVDVPQAKDNGYNSLYDDTETRIEGITVRLVNKSDNSVVATTTTGSDGAYLFGDVLLNQLSNLYVQFDYSGTEYRSYIPVAFNNSNVAGSRALYDEVPEYDIDLNGIVSTYKGTEQETTYGLSGTLFNNFFNTSNRTLEYINLGIKELPVTEYTLQENVLEAKIKLGDIEYTYEYGGRGEFSEGVPVVNWKDQNAYSADVYPSDISYAIRESQNIEATVTYRIDITNTTTYNMEELYVEQKLHIKNLINEFDSYRYSLEDSNWSMSSDGTATITENYLNEIYGNGLASEETGTAYITFSINPDAITDILNNPEGIAEESPTKAISTAYHEYTRRDYSWNNLSSNNNIAQTQTHYTTDQEMEDDAQYLVFRLANQRATSGIVFEDNIITTNGEALGNGQYDDGENRISGIKVDLLNESGEVATVYGTNTSVVSENLEDKTYEELATTTTDENGNYSFVGIIPGNYYIRFTYGDGTEQIAEYKSTVVTSAITQNALGKNTNEHGNIWYKNIEGDNYSVAVDNLEQRQNYNDGDTSITQIQAETALVEIETDCSDEETTEINGTECYEFNVFNFGLIKMPIQQLDLEKKITNINLTNSQGNVIVDGNPEEDIEVMAGVSTLDYDGNAYGYIRIELSEDQIYGTELTLTYEIILTNNSEINYYEEEGSDYYGYYYKYGEITEDAKQVTLTANEVMDYLDPALTYVSSNSDNEEMTVNEITYNSQLGNWDSDEARNSQLQTLVSNQESFILNETDRGEVDYASILSVTGWQELYSSYNTDTSYISQDVVEIIANKILSQDDDDMYFLSTAEVVDVDLPETKLITKIVEIPEKKSAVTTIIPPTGSSEIQTIITYTSAIAIILVVAVASIIIIKKKIL